jgi:hypothetical protein
MNEMRLLSRRSLVMAAMLPTLVIADPQTAPAQNYPTKPIRFVVGFTAGGGNDILARLVGQKLRNHGSNPSSSRTSREPRDDRHGVRRQGRARRIHLADGRERRDDHQPRRLHQDPL